MKGIVIFLLMFGCQVLVLGQQTYNSCNNALELCTNQPINVTNIGANKTFCPDCEDDFTFCFSANNTIWFTFTTNATGGDVQLDFSNLIFQTTAGQDNAIQATMLEATVPCDAASYTAVGNCVSTGSVPFSLNATGLPANTTYYVVVSGDLSGPGITIAAECSFDLNLSGTAVARPTPVMDVEYLMELCKDEIFYATAHETACDDQSTFKWYINGILVAETVDSVFQTTGINQGDILSVELTCFTNCPEVLSFVSGPITVYSFTVDAGPDLFINPGETVQLQGFTTAASFGWTPSFSVSNDSIIQPYAFPETTTVFTLSATENGCTYEDYVTVFVEEELIIPTTFSPNDDGINDRWEISGIDLYPDCYVRIYDRWGQEVFQSTNYTKAKSWDGTGKTGKLAEGVYFYIMELRDAEKQEFKGSITLIR